LLRACEADLANLLREVQQALDVPIRGGISDGQHSIRKAVQTVLPDVPHQRCHFHSLREAAKPVYEADRHAKKERKKHVRGVRPIERAVEKRNDAEAEAIRGYCLAVRSALTDDGRPPLEAPGLKLHARITAMVASLTRVSEKGAYRVSENAYNLSFRKGSRRQPHCGPTCNKDMHGSTVPRISSPMTES
ncbi:MAG: transposase, partial [Ktedonobacteraceae bacterium]|nr:transposase [Ktedonobacteraceae bacterium]